MNCAICVENLSVSYSSVEAINNISLKINKGEFVFIVGPNGGGKTTLLNTILGLLKANNGNVQINSASVSYVPQISAIDRNFPITVLETVMTSFLSSAIHPLKFFKKSDKQKAMELLRQVGLETAARRQISELSGGEFQRLLLARALGANPEILLLDEPTANVDPASREKIFSLLSHLNSKGMTIVAVTHDLSAIKRFPTKLICINRQLIYCGEPKTQQDITEMMYGIDIKNDGGNNNA